MDELLSMSREVVNEIFAKMTLIETIRALIKTLDEGKLVIQVNESNDFASLELLEERMPTIKGYINAELFDIEADAKHYLERITGMAPAEEVDFVPLEDLEKTPVQNVDTKLNSDIIKTEEAPMGGRKQGSGKLTTENIKLELEAGLTSYQIAEKYGMKESSVKKYIQRYKAIGTTVQTDETNAACKKANAKKEEATPARKRV